MLGGTISPGLGAGVKGAPGRRPGLNRGGGVLGMK